MKRTGTAAAAATVIAVVALSGCSTRSGSSNTGPSGADIAPSGAFWEHTGAGSGSSGTGAGAPAGSTQPAKAIVNGENLSVHGPTVCNVKHGEKGDIITMQVGDTGYEATLVDTGTLMVLEVIVGDIHFMGPGNLLTEGLGNSAQAERHGKTYKITGNALSFDSKTSLTDKFEIDATCP
jgi:hypothetical protein